MIGPSCSERCDTELIQSPSRQHEQLAQLGHVSMPLTGSTHVLDGDVISNQSSPPNRRPMCWIPKHLRISRCWTFIPCLALGNRPFSEIARRNQAPVGDIDAADRPFRRALPPRQACTRVTSRQTVIFARTTARGHHAQ